MFRVILAGNSLGFLSFALALVGTGCFRLDPHGRLVFAFLRLPAIEGLQFRVDGVDARPGLFVPALGFGLLLSLEALSGLLLQSLLRFPLETFPMVGFVAAGLLRCAPRANLLVGAAVGIL